MTKKEAAEKVVQILIEDAIKKVKQTGEGKLKIWRLNQN